MPEKRKLLLEEAGAHFKKKRCLSCAVNMKYYVDYSKFCAAAKQGCMECSIIIQSLQYFFGGTNLDKTWIWMHNKVSDDFGMHFRETNEYVGLRFYTIEDHRPPWPVPKRQNHLSEISNVETLLPMIQGWLDNCNQMHPDCMPPETGLSSLPTRVLDLGHSVGYESDKNNDTIRLLESNGARGRYTTLSHCWGKSQPIITNSANILAHRQSIAFDDLPLTFQNAVELTRLLGIQYLWIDSLCIIQGDEKDWETESSKMASVYSQSFLNIAAADASDSSMGLFSRERRRTLRIDRGSYTVFAAEITDMRIQTGPRGAEAEIFPLVSDLDALCRPLELRWVCGSVEPGFIKSDS